MTDSVEIIEVSPRDGIQNEKKILSTETKLSLIQQSVDAGVSRIEVTSFVNPKRVPQMADADEIAAALPRTDKTKYIGLALNQRGYDRASQTELDEVNFVVVASNTFSQRNQGTDIQQGIDTYLKARENATGPMKLGVSIAASFGCPFEGEVPLQQLLDVVKQCMAGQPFEIGLADTIGVATPTDIKQRVDAVKQLYPDLPIRLHLHNTRNTGIANAWAGIEAGVRILDSSFGGVGGCPFAPRATGNIATEDLIYMLHRSGFDTGVDIDKAIAAAEFLEQQLDKTVPGMVMKAGNFPYHSPLPT